MAIILETVIAVLSVFGLISLLWCAFAALLLPIGRSGRLLMLLVAKGRAPDLQKTVSGLEQISRLIARADIVVVDEGLDEESKSCAEILAARQNLTVCGLEGLNEYIKGLD